MKPSHIGVSSCRGSFESDIVLELMAETANDLGWNNKANLSEVGVDAPEPSEAVEEINDVASKLHVLSMEDNQPVIIPDHLKVPEAEYAYLSFGSFGTDFKTDSVTSYGLEEAEQGSVPTMENTPVDDTVEEAEKSRYNV